MEDVLLYCKDLHDPSEGDNYRTSNMIDKRREKMQKKTIGYIGHFINVNVFHHVSQKTNAHIF